ncbi:MAG TPA: phage tail protein [Candidatus Limnocylindrales bacterium]|jgi:phage tail-like protein|nr:phage tail protein [Candidatus Limnocylindrales bacterium]
MRGRIDKLATPHPLGPRLPALYQRDPVAESFTGAFDDILAPILSTLDNLDAYVDPDETPEDFLEWLGQWVGMPVDRTWPIDRQRDAVARAARIYLMRGTVRGLRELVEVFSGGTVEVVDNGGVGWSTRSGAPLPGTPTQSLSVRVTVPHVDSIDPLALDNLVRAAKPAHIPHEIELVGS